MMYDMGKNLISDIFLTSKQVYHTFSYFSRVFAKKTEKLTKKEPRNCAAP